MENLPDHSRADRANEVDGKPDWRPGPTNQDGAELETEPQDRAARPNRKTEPQDRTAESSLAEARELEDGDGVCSLPEAKGRGSPNLCAPIVATSI